jgi:hypothetical protein
MSRERKSSPQMGGVPDLSVIVRFRGGLQSDRHDPVGGPTTTSG